MKIWICRISLVIVTLVVVSAIAFISFLPISSPYRFYSLIKMPPLIEHFAAEELVDGKVIEQKIYLSEGDLEKLSDFPEDSSLCVGVLMATYGDLSNKGDVRYGVKFPDGRSVFKNVPAGVMRDNKYLKVCFDNLSLDHLQPGGYLIQLESVGGTKGSSVTVWLTKYIEPPFSSASYGGGSPMEGVLVAGFLARQYAPFMQVPVFVLVALYAGLIGLLFLILFSRKGVPD